MKSGDGAEKMASGLIEGGLDERLVHAWPAYGFEPPADQSAVAERLGRKAAEGAVVVVVSPAAARILNQLPVDWPKDVQFAAVGEPTAKIIRKLFRPEKPVIYPEGNVLTSGSEELFKLFEKNGFPDKVLIARGQTGRDFLQLELKKHGVEVDVAEVYRRIPLRLSEEQKRGLTPETKAVIYITSSDSVQILLDNLGEKLRSVAANAVYVCIHKRIEERLNSFGFADVHITDSKNPGLDKLLLSLARG